MRGEHDRSVLRERTLSEAKIWWPFRHVAPFGDVRVFEHGQVRCA